MVKGALLQIEEISLLHVEVFSSHMKHRFPFQGLENEVLRRFVVRNQHSLIHCHEHVLRLVIAVNHQRMESTVLIIHLIFTGAL